MVAEKAFAGRVAVLNVRSLRGGVVTRERSLTKDHVGF